MKSTQDTNISVKTQYTNILYRYWKFEGWALKSYVNHTGWMTVVAPADRSKLVRNRCVIERFFLRLCVTLTMHCMPFKGVCHMTASDILSC